MRFGVYTLVSECRGGRVGDRYIFFHIGTWFDGVDLSHTQPMLGWTPFD